MASKLSKITTGYHTFVPNQVLTHNQLNELVTYLDDQSRLAKVFLQGVGIVCGFSARVIKMKGIGLEKDTAIEIEKGIGITTDGDLIQLKQTKANAITAELPEMPAVYTHYKKFLDDKAEYEPFKKQNGLVDMWEILPGSTGSTGKLNNLKLDDKVVVLYLESYANDGNLCTSIDCDNQGIEEVQKLRILLISEKTAELIVKNDPVFVWHNIAEKYINLPEIKLPRVNLLSTNNLANLRQSFLAAMSQTVLTKLKEGYNTLYVIFGQASVSAQIDKLLKLNLNAKNLLVDFQYRYDLLADLIATYNEIKELLYQINVECSPSINSFPKHLFLGRLNETGTFPKYRHRMYKSPLSTIEQKNRSKVESLLARGNQLLTNYQVNLAESVQAIRITPSQLNGDLGTRAIPFYYSISTDLLRLWCFEKTDNLKSTFHYSYSTDLLADFPEIRKPLQFSTDEFGFYRIEGHLQLDALECRDQINSQIATYGLDFVCRIVTLDDSENAFVGFVKNHPQLEHRGGVGKGGTFVLVANKNKVVADFYLPYLVADESTAQNCCSLMECTYPWISSLKYLNNLARSTKGTQSRNKVMPKNYVLQVVEYRINGQNLINGATNIVIPLSKIFLRRIHSITEALNSRFDKGLVFDFNESQKRFVITYAKEDSFVLRVRDITLNYANPTYTFSNKGMFRNNKVFRPDAMRCRDLKKYQAAFYEALQQKIAPVNKDDDYGKFNEKWKKWNLLKERLPDHAEIQRLKLTRMITSVNQLPAEIATTVRQLKNEFQGIVETQLQFKLDGDWVNGEWVNSAMLDYYKANKKNTHDDLVLFVSLRKYLHSETGISKLSIYITNQVYNNDFDELIEKYNSFADIYFGAPSGANAISL
ncbi:hypothetical protein [uncultured Draconibacterium sp.]|uniref:hypothetical protein n=1 Tax=uncultured Draconibacterium sp. TaxID=1573823 RepID=UPI003216ACA3